LQNNWYSTYCDVSEDLVLDTSQILIDTGLRDLGYQYVVLDDCWAADRRDDTGHWRADEAKFPNGMKYVADTLHSRGLLYGMYSSAGELTCAGYRKFSISLARPSRVANGGGQPDPWIMRRKMQKI
jgi:alpha-galactosidase